MNTATAIGPVTNGGQPTIEASIPYVVEVEVTGVADLLFHAWNCEAIEAKGRASKGSKAKKQDDIASYVYRNDDGFICIPGEYLRGAIVNAAKFKQDPRSPRKSAQDMYRAGVISLTPLASLGKAAWDYEHKCRVTIQRAGVTRVRPAFKAGWKASFQLQITLPEYIRPDDVLETIGMAGRLIGLADFRPTYGRFQVTRFDVVRV